MAKRRWGIRKKRELMASGQEVEAAHRVMLFAQGRGVEVANRIDELRRRGLSWAAVLADISAEDADT